METDGETRAAPGRDMCLLRSAVSARGGRGVFVSITEQQTGPLEMKEPEWSQSKTSSAGRRYPTDSSSPLGPRRRNDPSSWIRSIYTHTHTHTHKDGRTHCFIALLCSRECFSEVKLALFHMESGVWAQNTQQQTLKQRDSAGKKKKAPRSKSEVL